MKKNILIMLTLLGSAIGLFSQNLLNGNFETWNTDKNPTGWSSLNWTATQFGTPYTCSKTIDKHAGTYAMKITTITYGNNTVDGIAFTGSWDNAPNDLPRFGYPYTKRPLKLKGYYKYSSTSGDSGLVAIRLSRWNSAKGTQDTIGNGRFFLKPGNTYTYFEIPIKYYMQGAPDTVSIVVLGSAETTLTHRGNAGNTLFIDDLSFEHSIGVTEPLMAESGLSVYPNPGSGYVTIGLPYAGPASLKIYDQLGKEVLCMQVESESAEIDLSSLADGVYSIRAEWQGIILTSKLSKIE